MSGTNPPPPRWVSTSSSFEAGVLGVRLQSVSALQAEEVLNNGKTEVVSVRVGPPIKVALQAAAEREMRSVANMVEVMVVAYCREHGYPTTGIPSEKLSTGRTRKPAA